MVVSRGSVVLCNNVESKCATNPMHTAFTSSSQDPCWLLVSHAAIIYLSLVQKH